MIINLLLSTRSFTACLAPKLKDYQSFNFGSGRSHNQTATMNMVVSVKTLTQSGAEVNSIIRPLIAIIMLAIHLALRGTVPLARQSRNVGPYLG